MIYRGRFAPSPTGPLHFGSLVAAVGSYLEARCNNGKWLVRIEDIDGPRCKPEWADDILRTLEAFGFEWDGDPAYQSQRLSLYQDAIANLTLNDYIYPCGCSRKEIADSSMQGVEGAVYPGTCRNGLAPNRSPRALRVRTNSEVVSFTDTVRGEIQQNVETMIGDFVVRRADELVAYQLAVVVDDAEQGVTHVVRGADLLLSTPRQIHLQKLLRLPTPHYAHLPVAVNAAGEKLSKQTNVAAIPLTNTAETLSRSLFFLGHPPPARLPLKELWQWAFTNWNLAKVPVRDKIPIASSGNLSNEAISTI
ncbi:MAG: tRNA glutamyl-Q(34) synthetase GluQRS [Pseudomonadota bacterium]